MKHTRHDRILGSMIGAGLIAAVAFGEESWGGFATLLAVVVGGFFGEYWHRHRSSES